MYFNPSIPTLSLALALTLTASTQAQNTNNTLTIGDEAPSIDIEHWLQGEPFTDFEAGKVYVVEFWATWCGPCIASMPHMSALHEEYGDEVGFVGVSDEPLDTVTGWMARTGRDGIQNGTRASYPLTTDPDQSVKKDYFIAAGQRGIPCAFLVGKTGRVEWIGHPMAIDAPLASVINDTWDWEDFKVRYEAEIADERLMNTLMTKVRPQLQDGDFTAALATLEGAREQFRDPANLDYTVFSLRLRHGLWSEEAIAATAATAVAFEDPMVLNSMAWSVAIATRPPAFQDALLDMALTAAQRATDLTEAKDGSILDTLARVHYEMGDLDAAIEWQEKAVAIAPSQAGLMETLENYKTQAAANP